MKLSADKIQLSPTDLANHLGCRHLTVLNKELALGRRNKPEWMDPAVAVLAKRGEEHEAAYVSWLKSSGLDVINIQGQTFETTLNCMQKGYDIIVQPTLEMDGWSGRADILMKIKKPSSLGDWSYEVQDTKLSRNTRASTLLQLCLYADIVGQMQGLEPDEMHVIKPGHPFEQESFRYDNFKAYYRQSKKSLMDFLEKQQTTYPLPVAHCGICRWWKECDQQRRDDDHLSLVANIRNMHIGTLEKENVHTLEAFAKRDSPLQNAPDRGNIETYTAIHAQAKIQLKGRLEKKLLYELLPFESGTGFARLPEPSDGDIYFDIEGDPFFGEGGIEYLLGYAFIDDEGVFRYHKLWAKTREEEKEAFDTFMSFVMERLKKFKDLHIYHFAPYEPSTIKRLTGRYGIHEADVDWLLRAERFVDLYAVIREGLRASIERYSLKDLERFTDYVRTVELHDASAARRSVEFALELNDIASISPEIFSVVEQYNADDCFATRALHQWTERLRNELIDGGVAVPRPELKTGEASEDVAEIQTRAKALYDGLTESLPADRTLWTDFNKAQWLLANQIDYFRRESKSAWWEFFRLHEMGYDDLINERKGLAGLKFISEVKPPPRVRSVIHKYSFPPQESGLDEGDAVYEVRGNRIGTIHAVDYEKNEIEIKKSKDAVEVHPFLIHQEEIVTIEPLATSIFEIAQTIILDGMEAPWPYRAAKDLLLKNKPRVNSPVAGPLKDDGEDAVQACIQISMDMKGSVLGIQGPPGAGKTYTGAMMILHLLSKGKKIGVTAPSHKVIRNLFDKVLELAAHQGVDVRVIHKVKDKSEVLPPGLEETTDNKPALNGLSAGKVAGGTAWLWAHNDAREALDYLFVDEAGQMSLAHVLAASRAAKNLILLGDPQQLQQPQKASHPEGADVSALTHLLDGHQTMPADKGIFLNVTRRLHPAIAVFTSEIFYENRLNALPGTERQQLEGDGVVNKEGLWLCVTDHRGNQNRSMEEVAVIRKIIDELLKSGSWTDKNGTKRKIAHRDIVVVAPYNAQVAALTEALPDVRVGTVDKFQGQEAPVAIFSMTSSSAQDAPRGIGFLLNPNRLNVATSRAVCASVIVLSETLLQTECRTIDQMKWINALCRYKELSHIVNAGNKN